MASQSEVQSNERPAPGQGAFGSLGKIVAVAVLTVVFLALLVLCVGAGTAKWVSDCYATHQGEQVRWTFPDGCQVRYGDTFLTVGT
jgi:ferric-dicitrate binding protein FerR (iron transport regulator)